MGGRPGKLTPQIQELLLRAIRTGSFPQVAARHAGISERTFFRWMRAGRKEDSPYHEFRAEVLRAEADAEVFHVGVIHKAAEAGDAMVSLRFLQIRWRKRYGRRRPLTRPDGSPLDLATFDPKAMSTPELEALVASLRRQMREEAQDDEV